MAYADEKAAILVHAQAAGAALSDPIFDVVAGFPAPKGRCVRVFWAGETDPTRMGARTTLNSEMIAEITRVVLFLPVSVSDEPLAAIVDAQLQAFKHDFRTRVYGDSQLGGKTSDLTFVDVVPNIAIYNNVRYAVLEMDIASNYTEYARAG